MQSTAKRGVMLDCSRNAVRNMETLKRYVSMLAKMGYNFLQLYTEDTYEIEGEPLFGHLRGRYAKTELKEIDSYCLSLGVELIPCIQTLAHLERIFPWSPYAKLQDASGTLLVDDEGTYKLIEKMFASCAECFTSRTIHIGMDEAHMLGRGKYFDKHGYENHHEIFLRHLNRVCEIAEKYGFTPMMWSDMFFQLAFGSYYVREGDIPEEVKAKVPKNIQLVYWDYYGKDEGIYEKMLDKHLQMDRKIWFAGSVWSFVGFAPSNRLAIERTRLAVAACRKKGVSDIFMTAWGDDGAECSAFATLPALFYAIECMEGREGLDGIEERFFAVTGEHWEDFMLLDIDAPANANRHSLSTSGGKTMLYSDLFLGKFDSLVFGTGEEREHFETIAKRLAVAKDCSENFAYLFESMQKYTEVVALKYDLGYRTHIAYQAQDKVALRTVADDYRLTIKKCEAFYQAYRVQWFTENKPHGFEVQDIRLGGLIRRIEHCLERLEAYLDGKLSRIEELEEPFVDYRGESEEKAYAPFAHWRTSVTANNIGN